jgi:hypothetical protein
MVCSEGFLGGYEGWFGVALRAQRHEAALR